MPTFEKELLNATWEHWSDVRGDRILPDKRDIDLVKLADVLPQVSLLDAVSPEELRYQLVGSEIVSRSGEELTGVNLLDFFIDEARPIVSQSIIDMFALPCAVLVRTTISYQSGRQAMADCLCLPLGTRHDFLGRALFAQGIDRPESYVDEVIANLGAEYFSATYIDIGAGKPADVERHFNKR